MGVKYKNTEFVNLFGDPDRPIYGNELLFQEPPSPTPFPTPTPTPLPQPSDISDLRLWYDASDESRMTTGSTNGFTTILEMEGRHTGGNLEVLTSMGASDPFLLSDSIGNYINFTADGEYLTYTMGPGAIPLYSAMTKFLVFAKSESLAFEECLVEISTGSRSHYYFSNYGGSETFHGFDYPGPRFSPLFSWDKNPNFINWVYMTEPLPYNYNGELNDIAYTAGLADSWGPVALDSWTIGARNNGGNPGNYVFREFLLYTRQLTTTEINQVETYLKTKWKYSTW